MYPTDVTLISTCRSSVPVSARENNLQMMFKHQDVYMFTFYTLITTHYYVASNSVMINNRCGRENKKFFLIQVMRHVGGRNGDTGPLIRNLGTRRKGVVNLTPATTPSVNEPR
jgi:hypothetical protein